MPTDLSKHFEAVASLDGRLDKVLALAFPDVSRARFQSLIAEACVTVEGKVVTEGRHKVKAGQSLAVVMPEAAAAAPLPEAMALDIVYEDADLIVIDKPPGLVVHPGAGNETGTLVNALIAHCGESLSGIGGVKRPGIVHRLDKNTSGLLVVAKNDRAHRALSEQFAAHGRDGRLRRAYLAVVWGVPERRRGVVEGAIARSTANRQKMAVSRSATARAATTHYEVLETYGTPPVASLLRCELETGRTHQIRLHMAHIGYPLLGDLTYGSGFRAAENKLGEGARAALKSLNRQALHAKILGFEHPATGELMHFERPPPQDMADLISALTSR